MVLWDVGVGVCVGVFDAVDEFVLRGHGSSSNVLDFGGDGGAE